MQSQRSARRAKKILSLLCDFLLSYSNLMVCSMFSFDLPIRSTMRSVFFTDAFYSASYCLMTS